MPNDRHKVGFSLILLIFTYSNSALTLLTKYWDNKPSYSTAMLPVQMNSYIIIGTATMLMLTLVAALTTITTAYGQVDPNFAGQVTSDAAKELRQSGSNFGAHTSDPTGLGPNTPTGTNEHGRNGLANALTERGEPQHPSEVIDTICDLPGDAAGCP
jgi:hypothetical protein